LALSLTLAISTSHASPPLTQKKPLMIYRSALVNGTPIEAGPYRVQLAPNLGSITFLSRGRVVATAPCRVGVVPTPALGDTVHYRGREDGHEDIVRIVFAGSSVAIEMGPDVERLPIADSSPKP